MIAMTMTTTNSTAISNPTTIPITVPPPPPSPAGKYNTYCVMVTEGMKCVPGCVVGSSG